MVSEVALYKVPEVLERARIIDSSVLPAYNESLKPLNEKARATLGQFGEVDGKLTGSSPFMLVQLANSGALPKDITRLATRPDLETAVALDETQTFLRGRYADVGLALRTAGDENYTQNDLPARVLAKQLESKGIELGRGKLIYLNALTNREDANSSYGLVFNIKPEVLDLNPENLAKFIRGLEEFNWSHTRDSGLACVVFYRYRGWSSGSGRLGDANADGRVVGISAEGASQNFLDEKRKKLRATSEAEIAEIAEIQERYAQ